MRLFLSHLWIDSKTLATTYCHDHQVLFAVWTALVQSLVLRLTCIIIFTLFLKLWLILSRLSQIFVKCCISFQCHLMMMTLEDWTHWRERNCSCSCSSKKLCIYKDWGHLQPSLIPLRWNRKEQNSGIWINHENWYMSLSQVIFFWLMQFIWQKKPVQL